MRLLLPLILASPALAEAPAILDARLEKTGASYSIAVTLAHPDEGWDHYADGWRVETVEGTVLGTRELAHPHVEEQPFTRSLSGLKLPEGTTQIVLRSRCSVDGWSPGAVLIVIP